MKCFLLLKSASVVLLLSTVALISLPRKEEPVQKEIVPQDGTLRVSFDDVRIGGHLRCKIRYDPSLGAEFKASAWGSERARVAIDGLRYWFWIKDYDSKRHYELPVDSIDGTNLIPPLRPSFLIWVLNDRSPDEPSKFIDGEYEVELKIKDGSVAEQTYTRYGVVETRIVVNAYQESSGRKFPALANLYMNGESIEILMGPAETSKPTRPNTKPPEWSEVAGISP